MTRLAMLIGSFLVTFALLLSVWMVAGPRAAVIAPTAPPAPSPTGAPAATSALPSPTQPPAATPTPTPTPSPSPGRTPSPSPAPTLAPTSTPSPSPAPLRTPPPSGEPLPSSDPGGTQTFVVRGADYSSSDVPSNGRVVRNGDVAVLQTSAGSSDVLWVTYKLDPAVLPAGVIIHGIDALVCGYGEGDFWEVYGPTGSEPTEYELEPPDTDGCWHFTDAPTTDMSVIAATMLATQLVIERVEFTITFGR